MEKRKRAILQLDLAALSRELFGDAAVMQKVRVSFDGTGRETLEMLIEHPELEPREAGEILPVVRMTFAQHADGRREFTGFTTGPTTDL